MMILVFELNTATLLSEPVFNLSKVTEKKC